MNSIRLRAAAALISSGVGLTWGAVGLFGQPQTRVYEIDPALRNESRLTSVETRLDAALEQLKEIRDGQSSTQYAGYFQLLVLSGLAGEAGLRLKNRKKSDGE